MDVGAEVAAATSAFAAVPSALLGAGTVAAGAAPGAGAAAGGVWMLAACGIVGPVPATVRPWGGKLSESAASEALLAPANASASAPVGRLAACSPDAGAGAAFAGSVGAAAEFAIGAEAVGAAGLPLTAAPPAWGAGAAPAVGAALGGGGLPVTGNALPPGAESCCLAAVFRAGFPPAAFMAPAKSCPLLRSV